MRVWVEESLCVGDGACVGTCPEIFEMRGKAANCRLNEDEKVPESLEQPCREAKNSCPAGAILVDERTGVIDPIP